MANIWVTREGKAIPIKDMGIVHMQNTIKYLCRRIENVDIGYEVEEIYLNIIQSMREELERRGGKKIVKIEKVNGDSTPVHLEDKEGKDRFSFLELD